MWSAHAIKKWEDEKGAEEDSRKVPEPLVLGVREAFSNAGDDIGIAEFCRRSRKVTLDASSFYATGAKPTEFQYKDNELTFPSDIITETPSNNVVLARVAERKWSKSAAIILPHWNAESGGYQSFSDALGMIGVTAVELTLPYHGPRNREGAGISDYFLSSNVGRTIRSVRQGVLDTRRIIDWLTLRGYRSVFVIGASLGSCVAGLTGAHDERVRGSILLLTAGDFADVVWTGRATRHIREGLQNNLQLSQLEDIWSVISLSPFISRLGRPSHRLMILSARYDKVVLPNLTADFVSELREAHARVRWRVLNCGHYTLGAFPFSWMAFAAVAGFLCRGRG